MECREGCINGGKKSPGSQNESISLTLRTSGFTPSLRHTSALLGVSKIFPGGGFMFEEFNSDTFVR